MLAKIVNDDAGNLDDRRAWAFFASKLAPTVIDGAVSASTSSTEKPLSQASQLPQRAWLPALLQQTCLFLQKRRTPTGVQVLTA